MVALPAASGILLALSLPPRPVPLLAVVALAPLAFHLCRLAPRPDAVRSAFLAGAVTGGVHAVLLLHWLPGATVPLLGVVGAVFAGLAVWGVHGALTGTAVALAYRSSERGPLPLPVALGGAWILLGWLPAALPLVGLPWLGLEAALVERPALLGAAGVIGGAGVAGLLAAAGSALGVFAAEPGRRSGVSLVVVLAVLTGAGAYGGSRPAPPVQEGTSAAAGLEGTPGSPDAGLRVAALSIDAGPDLLADRDLRHRVLPATVGAVDRVVGPGEVDLVLWPESPTGARDGAPERALARERAEARGTPVLFGALGPSEGEPGGRVLNRVLLAGRDGAVTVAHDKRRLVPGIEWAPPWESGGLAVGARRPPFMVAAGRRIGGSGSGATASASPPAAVPAGAAICFEALFPGEARRLRRAGARILFVVSNEGWLAGRGGGPFDAARTQHRAAAVLLAVETRMPVVRSAVGGPAGAWDARGRPLHAEVRRVEGAGAVSLVSVELAADRVPPSSRGGAEGVGLAALLLLAAAGLRRSERGARVPG